MGLAADLACLGTHVVVRGADFGERQIWPKSTLGVAAMRRVQYTGVVLTRSAIRDRPSQDHRNVWW